MKNLNVLKLGLFATIILTGISSCGGGDDPINNVIPTPKTVKVESVSLSKTTLSIEEGGEQTITVTVSPSNATNKKYTLTSSDSNILTVDENGKVKALKSGEATITVTTTDGNKTASCKVTVTPKVIPVEKINLEKTELSLEEESEVTITYTLTPENATDTSVTWSSSDSTVVAVDENGKLTAVMEGEAIVTAATADGSKTATCKVTVTPKVILVEKIELEKTELTILEGREVNITYSLIPDNATDTSITWNSSDPTIVVVDENGKLTALKIGEATITAATPDGNITATCKITVDKIIEFADNTAKERCVKFFDTNNDSELGMSEAAAVESMPSRLFTTEPSPTQFSKPIDITSFNELQYFTSLKEIPAGLFFEQRELKEILLPESVTSIGFEAFLGCKSLKSINLPKNVTKIDDGAFYCCSGLTSFNIPKGVTYIGKDVFRDCEGLTTINIPKNITKIDDRAFAGSGLTTINIPEEVTYIGEQVFANCESLKSINLPKNITKIDSGTFYNCSGLTTINIPEEVTYIGQDAFLGCDSLESIIIPERVEYLGIHIFSGCFSLKSVTFLSEYPPKCGDDSLDSSTIGIHRDATIFVPSGSVERYKSDSQWSVYADQIKAIP